DGDPGARQVPRRGRAAGSAAEDDHVHPRNRARRGRKCKAGASHEGRARRSSGWRWYVLFVAVQLVLVAEVVGVELVLHLGRVALGFGAALDGRLVGARGGALLLHLPRLLVGLGRRLGRGRAARVRKRRAVALGRLVGDIARLGGVAWHGRRGVVEPA